MRGQWQHTIARRATARQPNPGIRLVRVQWQHTIARRTTLDSSNQALNWWGLCVAVMLGMIRETTRTLTRGLTLGFIRLREQLQHTIAHRATARQPSPGIRLALCACMTRPRPQVREQWQHTIASSPCGMHDSSSPSGEGAMATHDSILALWHLACLHADGPYDSFSSQVREQWQHTIARPATARQPNPGTWWAGALQCTVRKWEWHNHVPMLTIHTPHGAKGPARLARGIEPPLPGANPGRCFRTQLHKSVVRVLVRVYSVRVNGPEECQNPAAAKQPSPGSGLDL